MQHPPARCTIAFVRAVSLAAILLALAAGACTRAQHSAPARGPLPSVLLVTIDTLRADRVGAYGDAQARTPNLDAIARAGLVFERAYAPAPLTLPSHATLLTGLQPPQHGVRGNGSFALAAGPATLAEALRVRGLRTAAFVGGFPLSRRFGLDRGFEHYDDRMEKSPGLHFDFAERRAPEVVAVARGWLAQTAGPVFVWVHLFDPHAPYDPPPAYAGSDPYRGEIAAVDAAVGGLLEAWDARPGSSFVAVTADHGEAFGEHGEESHSLFVYDTTLHVPLILRGPGVRARRETKAVGLADVGATLLARVGGEGPPLPGRDLVAPVAPRPLYAETLAPRLDFGWSDLRSWRDGRYKLIRAPRPELYDVESDPGETRDLAKADPQRAAALDGALGLALEEMGERETQRAPDPEAAERLRALGYAQGPGGAGSGADPKDRVEVALAIAQATGPFPDALSAARAYEAIVVRDPQNPLVNFRLADALLRAGRPDRALPYFKRVADAGPRSADPLVGLATAYAQLDRMDDARAALERALALEPANGQAHYNLGEIARARGDAPGARAAYEAALRDPVTRDRAAARLQAIR
jgi:arylsulfatase A-like enzyme